MKLAQYGWLFALLVLSFDQAKSSPVKKTARNEDLRLPRTILPRLYQVTLLPILIEGNFTTEGSVSILVDCVQSTNNITLHIADITFSPADVTVKKFLKKVHSYIMITGKILIEMKQVTDISTNQLVGITNVSEDKVRQFLVVTVNSQLLAGRQYRLSMIFTAVLNNELRGFYRSTYNENGKVKYMAVSQMQPTDARRAFPCFDEPNMKANFTMKLGRLTTQLSTSNMPVKETTPMSVHF